eukprot:c49297_g1_i1 orf=45-260(-)
MHLATLKLSSKHSDTHYQSFIHIEVTVSDLQHDSEIQQITCPQCKESHTAPFEFADNITLFLLPLEQGILL